MGWFLRPTTYDFSRLGVGLHLIRVKAFKVTVIIPSSSFVEVDGVAGKDYEGSGYVLRLGGLWDAQARPILVVHTFKVLCDAQGRVGALITEELIEGEFLL